MGNIRLVRLVAFGGSVVSAGAYLTFAFLNMNGDRWWHANKLWATVWIAPLHVLSAWTLFAVCGGVAYVRRRSLARRPFTVAAVLVGLPIFWAVGLRFAYYNQSGFFWPGFENEEWRWMVSHLYAEFAFGILVGFVGLASFTMNQHPRDPAD